MRTLTFTVVGAMVQGRWLVHVRLGQRDEQLFQAKLFGRGERRHAPKLRTEKQHINNFIGNVFWGKREEEEKIVLKRLKLSKVWFSLGSMGRGK